MWAVSKCIKMLLLLHTSSVSQTFDIIDEEIFDFQLLHALVLDIITLWLNIFNDVFERGQVLKNDCTVISNSTFETAFWECFLKLKHWSVAQHFSEVNYSYVGLHVILTHSQKLTQENVKITGLQRTDIGQG